jgi:hypothetical protein
MKNLLSAGQTWPRFLTVLALRMARRDCLLMANEKRNNSRRLPSYTLWFQSSSTCREGVRLTVRFTVTALVFSTEFFTWDFKFLRRRVWSSESSGMYCRVLTWMSTDVSEVRDGGSTYLGIVGRHLIKNIPEDSELQKFLRCYNLTLYSVNIGSSAIYLVYCIIIIIIIIVVVVTWPRATKWRAEISRGMIQIIRFCGQGSYLKNNDSSVSKQSKAVPLHATEALGGDKRYSSYSFLTSELDGVSGQRHATAELCPGERTPGTHCTGGWVGPRAGLDTEARGKMLLPVPGIEPRSPGRPVRSQTLYWLSYPGSLAQ